MLWIARLLIAGLVLSLTSFAFAFDGEEAPPAVDYTGHRVVRATTLTEGELRLMLELSDGDCWCENPGVGTRDYRIPPDAMARLEATGILFEVVIDDLGPIIAAERARLDAPAAAGVDWFADFKPFADIVARLEQFVADYPALASLEDIGDSIEGRDLWMLKISPGGIARPAVLYNGTQHAREWISPMVNMYIAEALLEGYGSDPDITGLLDNVDIYVIPVVNPDGYVYSWGPDRLWRKNRRDNGDGTFGVDPNRNWAFGWGGGGASPDTDDPTYYGTGPFSEPETAAMRDFYIAHPELVASIDFHAFSQLVLYPYAGQEGGPGDSGEHALLGATMADAIFDVHGMTYVDGPVFETLYQASGGSVDWTWGDQGVISYTVELRDLGQTGFLLPPEQIIPTSEENLPAALRLAEGASMGAVFTYPNGRPEMVPADTPTTLTVKIESIDGGLSSMTGRLWTSVDGAAFTQSPLTSLGADLYEGTLPGVACGSTVEWYVTIMSLFGTTFESPLTAPSMTYAAVGTQVTLGFNDDFESDLGWTVENTALTDGGWDRGVPVGGGDREDPAVDFDGSGACYLTDNVDGNSDVDGGPTILTSPVFDGTTPPDARLAFGWWFQNDDNDIDRLEVELSNDGGANWITILNEGSTPGWQTFDEPLADLIAPTSTMQLRVSATDNPNDSVTEAGFDGLRLYTAGCPDGEACVADIDASGEVGLNDLLTVLSAWGPCPGCPADLDGNGTVGLDDLLTVLSAWGACP